MLIIIFLALLIVITVTHLHILIELLVMLHDITTLQVVIAKKNLFFCLGAKVPRQCWERHSAGMHLGLDFAVFCNFSEKHEGY